MIEVDMANKTAITSIATRRQVHGIAAACLLAAFGCSGSEGEPGASANDDPELGQSSTGGDRAAENGTGGETSSGGDHASTGGDEATGGQLATGGSENTNTGGSESSTGGTDSGTGGGTIAAPVNCPGINDLAQCVSDMQKAGGGTIVLDAKTYLVKDQVILQSGVNIVGQGSGTVITFDDSVKDSIDAPVLFSRSADNVELEDFAVECSIDQDPNSEDLRNEQIGIYFYCGGDPSIGEETGCNDVTLSRIEVSNCSHGIHLKGVTGVTAIDLNLHNNGNTEVDFFHNVYFRRVGDLVVKQTTPTSGGYYDSPRGHGIRGSHLVNVYFEGLSVYNNADHGVHVDYVTNMRMSGMDIHDNCANPSGACAAVKCYSDGPCELNADAPKEP